MRRIGSSDTLKVDDNLKEQLISDWPSAELCEFDSLMLSYVEKITLEAHKIDRAYTDHLKSNGFTDRMLHDIVQVASYFAYVNRLADGLGVELEEGKE